MRILILSDNHSRTIDFETAEFDVVIHCGDYGRCFNILDEDNILFVKGNCDIHGDEEIYDIIDNKNIFITLIFRVLCVCCVLESDFCTVY